MSSTTAAVPVCCPGCGDHFRAAPHPSAPRALTCGHSFCEDCAQAVLMVPEPVCLVCKRRALGSVPNVGLAEYAEVVASALKVDDAGEDRDPAGDAQDFGPALHADTPAATTAPDGAARVPELLSQLGTATRANASLASSVSAAVADLKQVRADMLSGMQQSKAAFHAAISAAQAALSAFQDRTLAEWQAACDKRLKQLDGQMDELTVTCGQVREAGVVGAAAAGGAAVVAATGAAGAAVFADAATTTAAAATPVAPESDSVTVPARDTATAPAVVAQRLSHALASLELVSRLAQPAFVPCVSGALHICCDTSRVVPDLAAATRIKVLGVYGPKCVALGLGLTDAVAGYTDVAATQNVVRVRVVDVGGEPVTGLRAEDVEVVITAASSTVAQEEDPLAGSGAVAAAAGGAGGSTFGGVAAAGAGAAPTGSLPTAPPASPAGQPRIGSLVRMDLSSADGSLDFVYGVQAGLHTSAWLHVRVCGTAVAGSPWRVRVSTYPTLLDTLALADPRVACLAVNAQGTMLAVGTVGTVGVHSGSKCFVYSLEEAGGSLLGTFGSRSGSKPGEFRNVGRLCFSPNGLHLLVPEAANKRVQEVTPTGEPVRMLRVFETAPGCASLSGELVVVGMLDERLVHVLTYDTGATLYTHMCGAAPLSRVNLARLIPGSDRIVLAGGENDVYVVSRDGRTGTVVGQAQSQAQAPAQAPAQKQAQHTKAFSLSMKDVAFAPDGDMLLVDGGFSRVCTFAFDGDGGATRLVSSWGCWGSLGGQFKSPTALALVNSRLYVLDRANARVQVFRWPPLGPSAY